MFSSGMGGDLIPWGLGLVPPVFFNSVGVAQTVLVLVLNSPSRVNQIFRYSKIYSHALNAGFICCSSSFPRFFSAPSDMP